jgi:hypothetical protein
MRNLPPEFWNRDWGQVALRVRGSLEQIVEHSLEPRGGMGEGGRVTPTGIPRGTFIEDAPEFLRSAPKSGDAVEFFVEGIDFVAHHPEVIEFLEVAVEL